MAPAVDRITEIWIEGLRTLENIRLRLDGLTVLIGENGSGKTSIVEACELLRRAVGLHFFHEFYNIHGGFFAVLRQGASRLKLGVRVEGAGEPLEYEFAITEVGGSVVVESEALTTWSEGNSIPIISRPRMGQKFILVEGMGHEGLNIESGQLALSAFGVKPPHSAMHRLMQALESIEVQTRAIAS